MKRFLPLALVTLISFATPPLHADDNVAQAKAQVTLAVQAYREARYKDAIKLFREADKLDPHPEFVFNVGQAYEKLGDVPNALKSYRDYLRLSPAASDRATVEASIRNLEARLREKGVQQLSVFSTPPGATVLLDKKPMGETPWTGEIAPGKHMLVLRAEGHPDTSKEFTLADRSMDIDIALATGPATPPEATPVEPVPTPTTQPAPKSTGPDAPEAPPERHGIRPWTWAALGLGAVGLGGAFAFEMSRRSAEDDAAADKTQVGYSDKYDTMVGRQTASRVLLGVGGALVVVGGVLLVLDLKSGSSKKSAGLGCSPSGACTF